MKLEEILNELEHIRDMKFAPALHISNKIHELENKIRSYLPSSIKKESLNTEQIKKEVVSSKKVMKETPPSPISNISNPRDIKIKSDDNAMEYTPNVSINNISTDTKSQLTK